MGADGGHTGKHLQLVLMALKHGEAVIDGVTHRRKDGTDIVVPAGAAHFGGRVGDATA